MNKPMMKCGHAANARDENGNPVCVICFGIVGGATEIDESPPSLEGRMARCDECHKSTQPSSTNLPFFEYKPGSPEDVYYCGCRGWD